MKPRSSPPDLGRPDCAFRVGGRVDPSKTVHLVLAVSVLLLALPGCDKPDGEAEKAGKKMDRAAYKAGQEINKAADKVGQKLEQAGEDLRDASKSDPPSPKQP